MVASTLRRLAGRTLPLWGGSPGLEPGMAGVGRAQTWAWGDTMDASQSSHLGFAPLVCADRLPVLAKRGAKPSVGHVPGAPHMTPGQPTSQATGHCGQPQGPGAGQCPPVSDPGQDWARGTGCLGHVGVAGRRGARETGWDAWVGATGGPDYGDRSQM